MRDRARLQDALLVLLLVLGYMGQRGERVGLGSSFGERIVAMSCPMSAEAPHLISAEASCVLPPAGSFVGDEPPPASSPHGDVVGRSRRLSAESESGQDTVWADSSLCLPVGNKVAFDASRPNVVGDSDDDEEE